MIEVYYGLLYSLQLIWSLVTDCWISSALSYIRFLKHFFLEKSFLNVSILILHIKTVTLTNFQAWSTTAEQHQHFDLANMLLKIFCVDTCFLKWWIAYQHGLIYWFQLVWCLVSYCWTTSAFSHISTAATENLARKQLLRNGFP